MSYIETSFIPLTEYKKSEPGRLNETDLIINDIYVAMFALAANHRHREAAKLPVRITDIAKAESGLSLASIDVLDSDFNTVAD